jgi:hypothetical protein
MLRRRVKTPSEAKNVKKSRLFIIEDYVWCWLAFVNLLQCINLPVLSR